MPFEESRYPADWLRIAERDLHQQVTGYYLAQRYPLPAAAMLGEAEVAAALETAQSLAQEITEAVSV